MVGEWGVMKSHRNSNERAMKPYKRLLIISAITVAFFLTIVLSPPVIQAYRERARRQQTMDNLKQLGEALKEYEANHPKEEATE